MQRGIEGDFLIQRGFIANLLRGSKNWETEMASMKKMIECVPNFSEGRDLDKIEPIVNPFRGKEGVKLLDYQRD